jgi:hypothetical protein
MIFIEIDKIKEELHVGETNLEGYNKCWDEVHRNLFYDSNELKYYILKIIRYVDLKTLPKNDRINVL